MSSAILQTQALRYTYPGGAEALVDLDLHIARGRKTALLGPNGAGKSTLFLCLNGTLKPQTGSVLLDGQPMGYTRRELLEWHRRVGLVFQNPDDQLIAGTVEQDVALGPLNLGLSAEAARARAHDTLTALGLEHLVNHPLHALSHGTRRMVAIAGVLAMRPEVIIIDEPTAGLDPAGVDQLTLALDTIHQRGATLLISTHDMDFAYDWADDGIILSQGKIIHQSPIATLFSNPTLLRQSRLRLPRTFNPDR